MANSGEMRNCAILIDDYAALVLAIRARIAEIDLTYDSVDELAGFTSRYVGKLVCDPPIRRMSVNTMFALLGAVGARLELLPAEYWLTAQIAPAATAESARGIPAAAEALCAR